MRVLDDLRDRLDRRRETMACREAVELMSDYLDGALGARDRRRLETHLSRCPSCTTYLRQLRATVGALGRLEPDAIAAAVRAELVALYRHLRADS